MRDDNGAAFEEPESQEAFFAEAEVATFIGHGLRPSVEDRRGMDEIDPMLAKVGCSFLFIPLEMKCSYKL